MFKQTVHDFIELSALSQAMDAHLLSPTEAGFILANAEGLPALGAQLLEKNKALVAELKTSADMQRTALRKKKALELFLRTKMQDTVFLKHCKLAYEKGMRALCSTEDFYPELLRQSTAAPPILFVLSETLLKRETALWNQYAEACLTIIGSRKPSAYGEKTVKQVARQAAAAGFIVVSGMAYGIDHLGQRAALSCGAHSFAVLAGGADHIYPMQNKDLYEQLVKTSAVFSEHAPGTQAIRNYFPARNRIMSALSTVCVVIEATQRSGTLITVNQALEQGRDVWVVPGNIDSPSSKGCNRLLQAGANPLVDIEEFIEQLASCRKSLMKFTALYKNGLRSHLAPMAGAMGSRAMVERTAADEQTEASSIDRAREEALSRQICHALRQVSPAVPEQLALRLSLTKREVFTCLALLEMRGRVSYHNGSYSLTSREESYIHDNA